MRQANDHLAGASSGLDERSVGTTADADAQLAVAGLWAQCEAERRKRAADMPTEKDALTAMFQAYQRLKELGWREAIYCPKDGTYFDAIEAGSTGVHDCTYHGEWPKGSWWAAARDDMWPSHPILFRLRATALGGGHELKTASEPNDKDAPAEPEGSA